MARKRGKSEYDTVLKNRDKNYISDCWLEFTKLDEKELEVWQKCLEKYERNNKKLWYKQK